MKGQISLSEIITAIKDLHDKTANYINDNNSEPNTNSQASNEIANISRPQSYKTVLSQGGLLLEASSDHLIAFSRLISEPVLSISPWTCIRAIIESSSLSAWLLDTTIDNTERVSRSFAFRYGGLIQQRRCAHSAGFDSSKIDQRIDQVEKIALKLGYQRILDRNGKRIGIGQQMPSMTKLVNDVLDEEETYRLLSSIVHAHPWALQQLSFQINDNNRSNNMQNVFSQDTVSFERNISFESIIYLSHRGAYALAKALWEKSQLYGWDLDSLRNLFNTSFNRLHYKRNGRFWE